jgi:hypothetical protein
VGDRQKVHLKAFRDSDWGEIDVICETEASSLPMFGLDFAICPLQSLFEAVRAALYDAAISERDRFRARRMKKGMGP